MTAVVEVVSFVLANVVGCAFARAVTANCLAIPSWLFGLNVVVLGKGWLTDVVLLANTLKNT